MAVVFAQLEIHGASEGVHAFVVPIRDEDGEAAATASASRTTAPRSGSTASTTAGIWFDGVRVPRDHLLNRYADVTEDGRYVSSIENKDRRFFTMLGTLDPGPGLRRRRRHHRQQGRARGGDQVRQPAPSVRLAGHRRGGAAPRLRHAPAPAAAAAGQDLRAALHPGERCWPSCTTCCRPPRRRDRQRRALESLAAGTKAIGTWHASRTIQECREACGGAGYLMSNRIGALRADTDVFTTFEGDNHILLQLVAKGLLTDYSSSFGDLDQLGMVRFVAGLAVETVVERTSAHKLLERIRDVLPGGGTTAGTRRPGCWTRSTSSPCSGGARSTCSPASRAGSSAAWTRGWTPSRCSAGCRTT